MADGGASLSESLILIKDNVEQAWHGYDNRCSHSLTLSWNITLGTCAVPRQPTSALSPIDGLSCQSRCVPCRWVCENNHITLPTRTARRYGFDDFVGHLAIDLGAIMFCSQLPSS